jgi:hypothetical protein
LSPLHAVHLSDAVLQMGVVPTHALGSPAVHCSHLSSVVSQTDVVPVQRMGSPAVHWTHAPLARSHAGNVVVGHAFVAAVPLSPLHATHVPGCWQTGLFAPHCVESLHCTHVSVFVLQNGVPPLHCASAMH